MKTQTFVIAFISVLSTSAYALPKDFATTHTDASYDYKIGFMHNTADQYDIGNPAASVALSDDGYTSIAFASASRDGGATAMAATTVPANAPYLDSYNYYPATASASAQYTAFFMIIGGVGLATATLDSSLQGSLDSGSHGRAGLTLEVEYNSVVDCPQTWLGYCSNNQTVLFSESNSVNHYYTSTPLKKSIYETLEGSFTFQYGQAFALNTDLNVYANNGGVAGVNQNFSTFKLVLPEGATLISMSGKPFANPVPEPESYAMLLAGLGLMALVARRRMH